MLYISEIYSHPGHDFVSLRCKDSENNIRRFTTTVKTNKRVSIHNKRATIMCEKMELSGISRLQSRHADSSYHKQNNVPVHAQSLRGLLPQVLQEKIRTLVAYLHQRAQTIPLDTDHNHPLLRRPLEVQFHAGNHDQRNSSRR